MPTYEYSCIECDRTIEINRGIKEDEVVPVCEICGYKMTKVYSSFGIQFRGGGFYKTDNS